MKHLSVLLASAIRSYKPRLFDAQSPYVLTEAVKDKYQFKTAPSVEQLTQNSNGPFNFVYGKFDFKGRTIIIEQLLVTYVGILATSIGASTKTHTDDSDAFLDDLSEWMHKEYGVDTETAYPNYYHSVVEAVLDRPLGSCFPQLQSLSNILASKVEGYGYKCPSPFELSGFSMHFDTASQTQPPYLSAFSIERRDGSPYSANKYFSRAPLRTKDHKDVLAILEETL
jgi:hypothetical protein